MQTLKRFSVSEEELLNALDQMFCILEFSPDGVVTNANENYLAVSGYVLDDLIGTSLKSLCTADFLTTNAYADFWTRLKRGECFTDLFCQRRFDKSLVWLESSCYPILDVAGELACVILYCTDMTSRVETRAEVERKLDAVDRSMLMAEYTPHGVFLSANENFLSALGHFEKDVIGDGVRSFISERILRDGRFDREWASVCAGRIFSGQVELLNAGGDPVWLESIFVPVFDADGKLVKIAHFSADITWRRHLAAREGGNLGDISPTIDLLGAAVLISDRNGRVVYANPAFVEMFGYESDEIFGQAPTCLFGPAEKKLSGEHRNAVKNGGKLVKEEMAYSRNAQRLWVALVANPVFNQAGKHSYTMWAFTDITFSKIHEILQRKTLDALTHEVTLPDVLGLICREVERLIPEVAVAVMGVGEKGRLVPVAAPSLPRSFLDGPLGDSSLGDVHTPFARAATTKQYVTREDIAADPIWRGTAGDCVSLGIHACTSAPILASAGDAIGAVTFYYLHGAHPSPFHETLANALVRLCALTFEQEKRRNDMRQVSFYDPVTALPNRNLLVSLADRMFQSRRRRNVAEPVAIMCVNIDRFKRINDSFGFASGNALLDIVAKRLGDKRNRAQIVGKLGGDEFALIIPDCDADGAADLAQRVRSLVAAPCRVADTEIIPSVRIGISVYPHDGADIVTLLDHANTAMSLSRGDRHNSMCIYKDDFNARAKTSVSLESRLRSAVKNRELELYYQPQVYFASGLLHGAEALARWSNPELGVVSPAQFIPLAEESGIIDELSDWVVEEACRQIRGWRDHGLPITDISVNLSAFNFHDVGLPLRISRHLERQRLAPTDLVLELTESVLLDDNPTTMDTINRTHELGFAFSLDDFGTGYSSLCYLRQLPISGIKLDQVFVRDIHIDETSRKLSHVIKNLGESLRLTTVVEGVENEEQFNVLRDQGFQIVQGFYLSRPLPADAFEQWVQDRATRVSDGDVLRN